MTKQDRTKFQTAHWAHRAPYLADESELTTLSVRLPKELADDVALVRYEYRVWFDSEEEFVATAISYAISSLVCEPIGKMCL